MDETPFVQDLRELHGVRRRALPQVVGDDPQIQRVLVAGVAPNAPDEDLITPGGVGRQGVEGRAGLVHDAHAGGRFEQLPRPLGGDRLARLDVDRLGMPCHHGHAHARCADPDRLVAEDLARLVHQLALLVGVVLSGGEAARMGQRVDGDLVRVLARGSDLPFVQEGV